MRIECCKPNVTNTHTEYVIFIAFSAQRQLQSYIISTLRILLHVNQPNTERVTFPPFPFHFPITLHVTTLSEMTYTHIYTYIFINICCNYVFAVPQSWTQRTRSSYSNILHQHKAIYACWDQRCEECHLWSSSNCNQLHVAKFWF